MSEPTVEDVKPKGRTKAEPKAEAKAEAKQLVAAVYGDMLDLESGLAYKHQTPTEVLKETGWLRSQMAAGKIRQV